MNRGHAEASQQPNREARHTCAAAGVTEKIMDDLFRT